MKKLFWHSTILIKPVFGITPKSFNAIKVVSSFRLSFLFSYHHMFSSLSQGSISMPIIRIIKTSGFGMSLKKILNGLVISSMNWKNSDFAISLQYPQNNKLTSCSPAPFSRFSTSKHRLIAFNFTFKRFVTFLSKRNNLTNGPEEFLNCFIRYLTSKTKSIYRNSQNKILQKFPFLALRKPKRIPETFKCVSKPTLAAFKSAIFKFPNPMVSTFGTLVFHNILF